MGQYTELYIGKYFFSWKNEIPDYLAFIFEDSDFYSDWDESKDWFTEIGYKTTRELAIRKLEKFGFTIEFLAEIYDSFYDELYSGYEYYLKEHLSELGDSEAEDNVL